MVVYPNAKINIGLNVVEKREDGFHSIESILYPVEELFDVLEIMKHSQLEYTSTGVVIPGDIDSNLCVKAFQLIKNDFDIPNVKIHLQKNIPIGAGLGGGSSDASFMLKALNELFELALTTAQLISYAKKLGSDCAFFIENKPVYAFNKGDDFEMIDIDLSSYEIRIECPEIHIGTKEAYAGVIPVFSEVNLKKLIQQPIDEWKSSIKNDFEKSIFPKHSEIEELKQNMYLNGAIFASMTGSGSAVFGIFNQ
ncbi:MAG: 4-(cytidine 5'-diphospho)-2-C-methyl-D-erythritol kinase [Flavobacteriales bacterium]|nr:MAG: 4-(cytidine 5'-diphospho)-2-C-methyl-D-erythritol kinase [Flavobacteriales bacterium]